MRKVSPLKAPDSRAGSTEELTHVSLFSGIGGIDLAAEWAGFKTVAFVERDPFCQKVLAKHWPEVPIYDDVTTFDGTRYRGASLVSAGFPCQPHSVAGKRQASDDERDLWSETVNVVGATAPEWFLGENVPGLFSSESGRFFGRVVNDLDALGYRVGWICYGASDVGACHRRKRAFIVAYATGIRREGIKQSGPNGQDDQKWEGGRQGESERTCLFGNAERSRSQRLGQTRTTDDANVVDTRSCGRSGKSRRRSGQITTHRYIELPSRNWREWDVKPVVRSKDDGLPRWVVRHRINALKSLGNAVVPQQVFPILSAIAEQIRGGNHG